MCYNKAPVLHNVTLDVEPYTITAIVGPNGAGKTTLLKTIGGLLKPDCGRIKFDGERIDGLPVWNIVKRGLVYVPEGMRVFPKMSVMENLEVGAYHNRQSIQEKLKMVFDLFPELYQRRRAQGHALSGGEQHMVTLARGLMSGARLLLLDDPFQGLSPKNTERFCHAFRSILENGITLLVVGQHVRRILKLSHQAFLLEQGKVSLAGPSHNFLENIHIQEVLFGVGIKQTGSKAE